MEKRKIPIKNYIILIIICLLSVFLCMYMSSWYKTREEAKMPSGIMTGFLPEIRLEELDNFLLENVNIILYVSASTDESIKRFEKNVHDYIAREGLLRNFAYIDTKDLTEDFVAEKLNSRLDTKVKGLDVIPNFYVVRDGKIVDCLYDVEKSLNSKEAIQFIKKQGGM